MSVSMRRGWYFISTGLTVLLVLGLVAIGIESHYVLIEFARLLVGSTLVLIGTAAIIRNNATENIHSGAFWKNAVIVVALAVVAIAALALVAKLGLYLSETFSIKRGLLVGMFVAGIAVCIVVYIRILQVFNTGSFQRWIARMPVLPGYISFVIIVVLLVGDTILGYLSDGQYEIAILFQTELQIVSLVLGLTFVLVFSDLAVLNRVYEHVRGFLATSPRRITFVIILAILAVILGLIFFSSAGNDDNFISYWPAYTLSRHGEIVNYNGDRIEQSSSLLHVAVLAALDTLTEVEVEIWGPISSIVSGFLTVIAGFVLASRVHPRLGILVAVLLATQPFFLYWSYGGLETTLAALVMTLLLISYGDYLSTGKRPFTAILMTAITISVRPEIFAVWFCVAVGLFAFYVLKNHKYGAQSSPANLLRRIAILASAGGITIIALFIFRLMYFGHLFPQPVYSKTDTFSLDVIEHGLRYLFRLRKHYGYFSNYAGSGYPGFLILYFGMVVTGILWSSIKLLSRPETNQYELLAMLFVIAYTSFIVFTGGDWMSGGRFIVHMLPAVVLFVAQNLEVVFRRSKSHGMLVLLLVVALQGTTTFHFIRQASEGMPVWEGIKSYRETADSYSWFERTNHNHVRDIPTIEALDRIVAALASDRQSPIVIASYQMGMVPYFTAKEYQGAVRFVDPVGLVERSYWECEKQNPSFAFADYLKPVPVTLPGCDIAVADIWFDLGLREEVPQIYGVQIGDYQIVYAQEQPGHQFIAVRGDLLFDLSIE